MEDGVGAVRGELEDRAVTRVVQRAALQRRAIEVAAAVEDGSGKWKGPLAPGEAVEDGLGPVGGEFEDNAERRAPGESRAIEATGAIENYAAERVEAIDREAVEEGMRAVGRQLEDRATGRRCADEGREVAGEGRAVQVPVAVEHDAAEWVVAVDPEVVEDRVGAVGSQLEDGAVTETVLGRRAVEVAGPVEGEAGCR